MSMMTRFCGSAKAGASAPPDQLVESVLALQQEPLWTTLYQIIVATQIDMKIWTMDLDGLSLGEIFTDTENPYHIRHEPDNDTTVPLYYTRGGAANLAVVNSDGSGNATFGTPPASGDLRGICFKSPNLLFYTNGQEIRRIQNNDTGDTLIYTETGAALQGIAHHPGTNRLYYADPAGSIHRVDDNGSNHVTLISGRTGNPTGISVDTLNNLIFWTEPGGNRIFKSNLDGSSIEDVFGSLGIGLPTEVVADPGDKKLYWTEDDTFKLRVGRYNGSGITDLVTFVNRPYGLDLIGFNR